MLKFKEEETYKLVELYIDQECLWNLSNENYRNKYMRQAAEIEIIEKLGKDGFGLAELKQKIKNLRCTYNQECNKIKNSVKSGAYVYVPSLKWFHIFDRIMKIAKAGKKTEFFKVESLYKSEISEQGEFTFHDEVHPDIDAPLDQEISKRKFEGNEVTNVSWQGPTRSEQDDHDRFGEYVALELRTLKSDYVRRTLKNKIRKAIVLAAEEDEIESYGSREYALKSEFDSGASVTG